MILTEKRFLPGIAKTSYRRLKRIFKRPPAYPRRVTFQSPGSNDVEFNVSTPYLAFSFDGKYLTQRVIAFYDWDYWITRSAIPASNRGR